MDTLGGLISIATLLIGIPATIVAMRELEWIKARSLNDTSAEPLTVAADDDTERVVLTLTPENVRKAGTIQHDLANFETRLPSRYRNENDPVNGLIRNPSYIRWSANGVWRTSIIGAALQALFIVIALYVSEGGIRIVVEIVGAVSVVFLAIMALQAKKALIIINEYFNFLDANKITIGVELSMPRSEYETRRDP
jgi:hypothetical protein